MSDQQTYLEEIFGEDYAEELVKDSTEGLVTFLMVEQALSEEAARGILDTVNVDLSSEKAALATHAALEVAAEELAEEVEEEVDEVPPKGKSPAKSPVKTPAKTPAKSPVKTPAKTPAKAPAKTTSTTVVGSKDKIDKIDLMIARVEVLLRTIISIRDYGSAVDIISASKGLARKIESFGPLFEGTAAGRELDTLPNFVRGAILGETQFGPVKFSRLLLETAKILLSIAKSIDDQNYFGILDLQLVGGYPSSGDAKSIVGFALFSAGTFKGSKALKNSGFNDTQVKNASIVFLIPSAIEKAGLKAKAVRKGKIGNALQADVDRCRKRMDESNFGNVAFGVRNGQKLVVDGKETGEVLNDIMGMPFGDFFFNKNTLDQIQQFLDIEREKTIYYTLKASSNRKAKAREAQFNPLVEMGPKRVQRGADAPTVYLKPFPALIAGSDYDELRDRVRAVNTGKAKVRRAALEALGLDTSAASFLEAGLSMGQATQSAVKYSLAKNGELITVGKDKKLRLVADKQFQNFLNSEIGNTKVTIKEAMQESAQKVVEAAESGMSQRNMNTTTRELAKNLPYENINHRVISPMISKLVNRNLTGNDAYKKIRSVEIARPGADPKAPKESTDDMDIGGGVTAGQVRELLQAEAKAVRDSFKELRDRRLGTSSEQ